MEDSEHYALFPGDRFVPLASAQNFREVGGYPTEDGRRLRRRMIWRSASLDDLTAEDAKVLSRLGIRLIADLRRASEREIAAERVWPTEEIRLLWWDDVSDASPSALAAFRHYHGDGEIYRAAMLNYYQAMMDAHVHRLRDIYQAIAQDCLPVLIHCAAGKDRTGFAVALLLKLLGVQHDYVLADYAVSERLIDWDRMALGAAMAAARTGRSVEMHPEARRLICRSDVGYLEAALDHVAQAHGSLAAFAETQLGVSARTMEALRARLLEA